MSPKGSIVLTVVAVFVLTAVCLSAVAPAVNGAPEPPEHLVIVQDDIRTDSDVIDIVASYEKISAESSLCDDVTVIIPSMHHEGPDRDLVDGMKEMIHAGFVEADMHGTPQEIAHEHGFDGDVMTTSQLHGVDLVFLGKVIDLAGDLGDRHLQDRLSALYGLQSASAEYVTLSTSDSRRDGEEEDEPGQIIYGDEDETDSRTEEDLSFSAEVSLGLSSRFDVQVTMNGLGADGAIGSSI